MMHWKNLSLRVMLIAIAMLVIIKPSASLARVQDDPAAPAVKLDAKTRSVVTQLVRQLGSDDFEQRQRATRELWQIGTPALEILQAAIDGNFNQEAKMRASDLTTFIKVDLSPDEDSEVLQCVVGFLDREMSVQSRAIQKLCFLEHQETARKLIDLVPSETEQKSLRESCSIGLNDAQMALRSGDNDRFMEWIRDPLTAKTHKLVFYYTLWVDDQLEPEIERLKKEASLEIEAAEKFDAEQARLKAERKNKPKRKAKNKKEAQPPSQPSLRTLVGLMRFLERWDEGLEFADKIHNKQQRKSLHHAILMESANWKELAKLAIDPEAEDADDDDEDNEDGEDSEPPLDGLAYSAVGYRLALVHFYSGDKEAFEAALATIEAKIEEEREKQEEQGLSPPEEDLSHAQFLRYTLEFERSLKFKSLEKNFSTFELLTTHRRFAKLFKFFGFETFKGRAKYFKSRSRRIRSLIRQVDLYPDQADQYYEKLEVEFTNWGLVCGLFANLGLDEEAELYYRMLYFDYREHRDGLGGATLSALHDISARESAWEIAKLELERNKDFNDVYLLSPVGYSHEAAIFLNEQLKPKFSDPYQRIRKVAALIRSPMALDKEPIDLWSEIANIDFSSNTEAARQLFMIWGVEEEKLFSSVALEEESAAIKTLMKQGKYLQAARKYEAKAISEEYDLHYAEAWNAYKKAGDLVKARQMRLMFAVQFEPYDAYDYTDGYAGTEWQSLPFDIYRLYDALEGDSPGGNCYYLWRMTNNDTEANLSAHQKMVRMEILRLQYIDSPYFDESEKDHRRLVEGSLDKGDLKTAMYWFDKLSTFLPADSGFVEDSFPVFEKIGSDEIADKIFARVSDDFYAILKSFPNSAMYLNNYAWSCACAKRNVSNAIELAKRAVELRPACGRLL